MKKTIIFFSFFIALFCFNLSLATYPSTCSFESQSVLNAVGGCSSIDCYSFSNLCGKCCEPTVTCTSFSYSKWSVCRSNGVQTRTVISRSPSGCTGGAPITNRFCDPVPSLPEVIVSTTPTTTPVFISTPNINNISTSTVFIAPVFAASKNEIESGETVVLVFSGADSISKYTINFTCPKFSFGLEKGLPAASIKIDGAEYCNKYFPILATTKTKDVAILNKAPDDLKVNIRLNAFNFQEQFIGYTELDVVVKKQLVVNTASSTSVGDIILTQEDVSEVDGDDVSGFEGEFATSTFDEVATSSPKVEPIVIFIELIKSIFVGIFRIFGFGE